MNIELARRNMLTQQFRTCDILNDDLLTLLQSTPREAFVPTAYEPFAFSDIAIPIGHGESMLNPVLEAKILHSLQIKGHEKILEIGTGSAYFTAVLGKLAKKIISIDIHQNFLDEAVQKLSHHGVHNVELIHASGVNGFAAQAPYDLIIYTGALPELNKNVLQQLKPAGKLFAIIGEPPAMHAIIFSKTQNGIEEKTLFETVIKYLEHTDGHRFVF